MSNDAIHVGLILASAHFEKLVAREDRPDIHLVLRANNNGYPALEFDGKSFTLPPRYKNVDADDLIQGFVIGECRRLGRADLLESFQRM